MATQPNSHDQDHKNQLVFDAKQTSWIVSALLLLLFFVFMIGFFIGKHHALEQFSETLDQESIADKIYSSLYATYEGKPGTDPLQADIQDPLPEASCKQDSESEDHETDDTEPPKAVEQKLKYYATLIGFGSKPSAEKYAERLTKLGYAIELKLCKSVTSKGRLIHWYQILTKQYESRTELEALVATLKKREYLNNISIMTV